MYVRVEVKRTGLCSSIISLIDACYYQQLHTFLFHGIM